MASSSAGLAIFFADHLASLLSGKPLPIEFAKVRIHRLRKPDTFNGADLGEARPTDDVGFGGGAL
jgi:hypothetical protein